jgi:diguanylate cyclase (GGDEF)-like protein
METDRPTAMEIATRICACFEAKPVLAGPGLSLPLTVSAGVAVMPGDAESGKALVAAADRALYTAKARGRNRAVSFRDA